MKTLIIIFNSFLRRSVVPLALLIGLLTSCDSPQSSDTDLKQSANWTKLANGVWSLQNGDFDGEIRFSDLAGAEPKIDALNELSDPELRPSLENVEFTLGPDNKLSVRIPTESDEKIFGYGLQFDNTLKSGQILELKVDHFNKGGGATHAPVPFFVSSKGYGVLFNTSKIVKVYNQIGNRKDSPNNPPEVDRNPPDDEPQPGPWLSQPPGDAVEAYIHGDGIELIAFAGPELLDVVSRYNLFSGGGAMPPLWGLGFWHRVPSKFSAAETEQEIADFKENDIPLDVIGLEPGWQSKSYPGTFEWQKKRFPDPAAFTKKLLDDGIRLNLWENPYISKQAGIYEEMYPLSGSHMVWLGIVPDYTLSEARKILLDQHERDHVSIGISGYKIDEVDGYDEWLWPDHATFPSGTSAESMRQSYGMQMQHMLYHGLFRKRNQRTYSLVRASNGMAANLPFAIYSDSYGHDEYLTGISSASLSGILWCPEIRSAKSTREWINRMHTVAFSPMAMLNAWASGTKPWSFPEATSAVRATIQLRMKLLPYLYTAFAEYNRKGIPPIRSMLLEKGLSEEDLVEDNSMFMFGPDILVAPFLDESTQRNVSLPEGNWYDFYSGKLAGNNEVIEVAAQQTKDLPPLFVREGALIPMLTESVNRSEEIQGADLDIRHYGSTSSSYDLYEDDGTSYNFEQGEYNIRRFSVESLNGQFQMSESIVYDGASPFYGSARLVNMTK